MITRTGYFRRGGRRFQQGDFDDTVAELDGLARWIAAHGIQRQHDRLARYTEDIHRLAEANAAGPEALTTLWNTCGAERLSSSILEATEWTEIYSAFGSRIDPQMGDRLAKALKGPPLYRNEQPHASSNQGRDFQAELAIAAQLVSVGIGDVHFGPIGDSTISFGGRLLFIETKRPATPRKVEQRVREANRQLAERYADSGLDPVGVVGLSVTKILNPDGGRAKVTSWSELDAALRGAGDLFVEEHDRHWIDSHPRTLGALILFRFGTYITEGPWFAPAQSFSFSYSTRLEPDRVHLARRLRDRLAGDRERVRLPGLP